jgi:hypothetical protein
MLVRAQPEHAVGESRSPKSTHDDESTCNSHEPAQNRVPIKEDARDSDRDSRERAQDAVRPSEVTTQRHD